MRICRWLYDIDWMTLVRISPFHTVGRQKVKKCHHRAQKELFDGLFVRFGDKKLFEKPHRSSTCATKDGIHPSYQSSSFVSSNARCPWKRSPRQDDGDGRDIGRVMSRVKNSCRRSLRVACLLLVAKLPREQSLYSHKPFGG